ncbi:MAG: hypothetical protein MZV70_07885 [Desulfobacterales bacterium]|nr:hypothetical protein [Desulfobacterales bacterium]
MFAASSWTRSCPPRSTSTSVGGQSPARAERPLRRLCRLIAAAARRTPDIRRTFADLVAAADARPLALGVADQQRPGRRGPRRAGCRRHLLGAARCPGDSAHPVDHRGRRRRADA